MTIVTRMRIASHQPLRSILVTGGAGFIGSNLVDSLLEEGCWFVVVVDNFDAFYSPEIKRHNIAAHISNPNFKLYETDIRDVESIRRICARHDFCAIVHLASKAGIRPSLQSPGDYLDNNVTGRLNMLECARDFKVGQFIFGSSSSVYGLSVKVPFSEGCTTAQPISPYAASESAAELLCHTYAHLYDVRCVCLRFFTAYGPRQRPDLAIHKFARLIHEGRHIPVFGDGTARRDYTYVDDIVQGVRAAIGYRGSKYEFFNLGESQTIELRDLITLLERNLSRSALIDRREAQASKMLGYMPKTKIHEGIPKFVEWFLKNNVHHI